MNKKYFVYTGMAASILALFVIVLGAFVRLSDAGLGCPDWPGCYGQITVPEQGEALLKAELAYPHKPVESAKAWKEMIHRYFASTLGFLILIMAALAIRNRKDPQQKVLLPVLLVGLVIFQGLLGMWTVTLLLKPVIVTLHLLTGLLTLSLLVWVTLSHHPAWLKIKSGIGAISGKTRGLALAGLLMVACQIFLGGWTSTNYAALYCTDFPTCHGQWIPQTNFSEAYTFIRPTGVNYEGGVLSTSAGVTVHFMHRVGAVLTLLIVGFLALRLLFKEQNPMVKGFGGLLLALLTLQISLGIANVLLLLPIPIAVSHNAGAALLLLSLVFLNHLLKQTDAVPVTDNTSPQSVDYDQYSFNKAV